VRHLLNCKLSILRYVADRKRKFGSGSRASSVPGLGKWNQRNLRDNTLGRSTLHTIKGSRHIVMPCALTLASANATLIWTPARCKSGWRELHRDRGNGSA
jgi:hypothetical protein